MEPVAVAQFPEADPGACARLARRRFYRQRSFDRRRAAGPERRELIRQRETFKEDVLAGLGARARHALRFSRGVAARLCEAEAEILARIKDRKLHESVAYEDFRVFCTEILQMDGRTADRRIELLALLRRCPALLEAFRAGVLNRTQILALGPVVTPENAADWVFRMRGVSVEEIKDCVRMELAARGPAIAAPPDTSRVSIAFSAPETAGLAFEHAIETTRRVLGWDAPRGTCLAAILAEAESSLLVADAEGEESPDGGADVRDGDPAGPPAWSDPSGRKDGAATTNDVAPDDGAPDDGAPNDASLDGALDRIRPGRRKRAKPYVPYAHASDGRIKDVRKHLGRYEQRLLHADRLIHTILAPTADWTLDQLLDAWKHLQALSRPLHVLETRLLYRLHRAMVMEALGYFSIIEFMQRELLVSDRTADHLLLQGKAFESTAFRQAFIAGRVGRAQIDLLDRPSLRITSWWLDRAHELTHRQFAREVRFLNRLHTYERGVDLDRLLIHPPPWKGIEAWLRRRLFLAGFAPEFLEKEFAERGLTDTPDASPDPAENPRVLARLDLLLDFLILARAQNAEAQDAAADGRAANGAAATSGSAKTVSGGRHHRIVIWTETWVAAQWQRLLHRVRRHCGAVPPWAAAVILLSAAVSTWEAVHQEFRPTQWKILERDGYRCRAPGCTLRRFLEVHHVDYRSHGGDDDPGNLITLCHGHHHHGVHRGKIRIHGSAPHDLTWEIGARWGYRTRWTYKGERLIQKSRGEPRTGELADHEPALPAWSC